MPDFGGHMYDLRGAGAAFFCWRGPGGPATSQTRQKVKVTSDHKRQTM